MKLKSLIAVVFIIIITSINVYAKESESDDVILVGVYEARPFYEIDDNGNVSGYYHDLLMLLQEKSNFKFEYVISDFSEGLTNLKEGKIDIMLGVSVTSERLHEIIYNKNPIITERFALYAKEDKFKKLSNIKEAKIGLVKDSVTVQLVLEYFSSVGIDVDPIFVDNWPNLEKQFEEGKVDIIPHSSYLEEEYYKISEFSGDQVYVAANKERGYIIDKLDKAIEELSSQKNNPIKKLQNKFYKIDMKPSLYEELALSVILLIMILCFTLYYIPKLVQKKIKEKIRVNMRNDNYLLQYQPIYNPRNRKIVGFEGLLRLLDEDRKLIPPLQFISEIEDNKMLFEVSLWILEKAVKEYQEISQYDCVKDTDFYISVNISLEEIENKKFIDAAGKILAKSNLGPNKICLEIIERIKLNDLSKVANNLMELKQAGFKIAIDDFGTEYSNLDLLLNLDTHVIKIDKCFVEGIDTDEIKNEVIHFISRIAEVNKKHVILEGVEKEEEAKVIENMETDLIYVQGYYYNKPLYKEEIKYIQG